MSNTHEVQRVVGCPASEKVITGLALEVLGSIPEWYSENKREIERNKIELQESRARFLDEITRLLEKLDEVR